MREVLTTLRIPCEKPKLMVHCHTTISWTFPKALAESTTCFLFPALGSICPYLTRRPMLLGLHLRHCSNMHPTQSLPNCKSSHGILPLWASLSFLLHTTFSRSWFCGFVQLFLSGFCIFNQLLDVCYMCSVLSYVFFAAPDLSWSIISSIVSLFCLVLHSFDHKPRSVICVFPPCLLSIFRFLNCSNDYF